MTGSNSPKQSTKKRLLIATGNRGKFNEIAELLTNYHIDAVFAGDKGLISPDETGNTFAENAQIKAISAAKRWDIPALSDDSGLCVVALGDRPGVHSARWAKIGSDSDDFEAAMNQIANELIDSGKEIAGQRAWFGCALCLGWPDGKTKVWFGRCDGQLVWPVRGKLGFGYDPIFCPDDQTSTPSKTFGEMDSNSKHGLTPTPLSHRARAFSQMAQDIAFLDI